MQEDSAPDETVHVLLEILLEVSGIQFNLVQIGILLSDEVHPQVEQ